MSDPTLAATKTAGLTKKKVVETVIKLRRTCVTTTGTITPVWRVTTNSLDAVYKDAGRLGSRSMVSTVHFKKAVQSRYEADSLQQFVAAATRTADDEEEEAGRKWVCPVPNCFKAYRQPSGLRYHQKHGHAPETFLQFDSVPPALERELPKKAKKMRFRKDNDPMTAASSPSGLAAASPLVSGSAALPSSSNAAAVPA
ncbi:hypothetical protein D9611_003095 [Ephemerocybe angulata]|uniref:C2H2-type domain-containing protein n=1 Tax=Ephemerocybe angulata TaxID=980116 RepID=A0A8H5FHZ5_9AGAR|nr:hypothetical protein D9611_003095 [Tulosesus angulatus]